MRSHAEATPMVEQADRAHQPFNIRRVWVGRPPLFWVNLAVKAALVGLLLFAALNQDIPRFHGKAMTGRALTYPIAAVIVPIAWWLLSRRRAEPIAYPYVLDILLVAPFLIDTAGNALNLYDTIDWWDDFNHFLNWGILTAGFGQLLLRLKVGRWELIGLCIGFGAVTAVLWEFAEYITFVRNSPELQTAYTDTLGDLGLDLLGSTLAAFLVARFQWGREETTAA